MKTYKFYNLILLFSLSLIFSGCHLIFPLTKQPPNDLIRCVVPVEVCDIGTSEHFKVNLVSEFQSTDIDNCYTTEKNFNVGPNAKFYCDANWVVEKIDLDAVKGSTIIRTPSGKFKVSDNVNQFGIRVNSEFEDLFVAFDSRAISPPDWLSSDYQKLRDVNKKPYLIHTTMPERDQNEKPTGKNVSFEIWKYGGDFNKNSEIYFNANMGKGAAWTPNIKMAMYFVLVKPKEIINRSNCQIYTYIVESGCYEFSYLSLLPAKIAALETGLYSELLQDPSFYIDHNKIQCNIIGSCYDVNPITQSTITSQRFEQHSKIAFTPTSSSAIIQVGNQTYKTAATGDIFFQYSFNQFLMMQLIDVQNMFLRFEDINTPIGKFSDIALNLVDGGLAICSGINPPTANPCDDYMVVPNTMKASLIAKHDDGYLYEILDNGPLSIHIDQTKQQFNLSGGPLTADIWVNDKIETIKINISVTGKFENFAPMALTTESDRVVECADNKNQKQIHFDANASFDIYDQLPPSGYAWFEDYHLLTQKKLGDKVISDIPPGQMNWGQHKITLEVRDSDGVPSTDTFTLKVVDRIPPKIEVDKDQFAITSDYQPVKILLARPLVSDQCSDQIAVMNNAPSGNYFDAGITAVEWTADDHRGNLNTSNQYVYVFNVPHFQMDIDQSLSHLYSAIHRQGELLTSISSNASFEDLVEVTKTFEEGVRRMKREQGYSIRNYRQLLQTVKDNLSAAADIYREIQGEEHQMELKGKIEQILEYCEASKTLIRDYRSGREEINDERLQ